VTEKCPFKAKLHYYVRTKLRSVIGYYASLIFRTRRQ